MRNNAYSALEMTGCLIKTARVASTAIKLYGDTPKIILIRYPTSRQYRARIPSAGGRASDSKAFNISKAMYNFITVSDCSRGDLDRTLDGDTRVSASTPNCS